MRLAEGGFAGEVARPPDRPARERQEARAKRNAIARDLHTPKYRMRVVRSRKGAGSYSREADRVDGYDRDDLGLSVDY